MIYEPVPAYFAKLKALHAGREGVLCVNAAVSDAAGRMAIHVVAESYITEQTRWMQGIASLHEAHLRRHNIPEAYVKKVDVDVVSVRQVQIEHACNGCDLLMLDVEGHEEVILGAWDFDVCCPKVLVCESKHLAPSSLAKWKSFLSARGYEIAVGNPDLIAVRIGSAILPTNIEKWLQGYSKPVAPTLGQ